MTPLEVEKLLPSKAIENAVAVVLENCGETVGSVGAFAFETETRHDLTPADFREFFSRWNVQRLGAFEAVPK